MPIKFRCQHCRQFLGISRSKAGSVTDCPTCGRTIRIPNLDGKVAALPKPKLNLQDSELIKALGALASIDDSEEDSHQEALVGNEAAAGPGVAVVGPPQRVNVIDREAPVPISDEVAPSIPPDSAEVASDSTELNVDEPLTAEPASSPHIETPSQPESEEQKNDVLADLAEATVAPQIAPTSSPPRRSSHRRFGAGSLMIASLVCALCGGIIGRALFPRTVVTSSEEISTKAQEPIEEKPVVVANVGDLTFNGTVTYVSPTGESVPDRGARVLILPLERIGKAKLSVAGFRVGAGPADVDLLRAEIRALGGDFVVVNDAGKYELNVDQAGRYGFLIASNYQPRDTEVLPSGAILNFIATYFERPGQLIGKVQFHYQTCSADTENKTINHHFEIE